jgi:hypothetical protein
MWTGFKLSYQVAVAWWNRGYRKGDELRFSRKKFPIGIPNFFFSRNKNLCPLLGFVDQQVSNRNSNLFFHRTKILWLLGLGLLIAKFQIGIQTFFTEQKIGCLLGVCWSASTWQWRRSWETLGSSCVCRLVGEWQLPPSQVSISADPFGKEHPNI